jgi:2-polyprenyl-3-methyl-5-hydroxy-6-metoxy-1,4-benzoquinol methylase
MEARATRLPNTIAKGQRDGTFIQFQYDDLAAKSQDLYANTKFAILESYLLGLKNLRMLNVGCGSGELSLNLAERGHDVVGVDIEAAHIDLARNNAIQRGAPSNCQFSACALEDFRSSEPFDCIVSTDVLEHIEDDKEAIQHMMALLRPRGLLLLAVPAGPWLFGFHDEQLGHYRRYTKKTLSRLVEPYCQVQILRYFGFTLVPICLLYSKWLRQPYPVAQGADVKHHPVKSLGLRALLKVDRYLPMPCGTSLLMKAIKVT